MAHISNIYPMIPCKKASELIDKKTVLKLSVCEKMTLKLHIVLCEACKRYEEQSQLLERILKSYSQTSNPDLVPQYSNDELKDKIFTLLTKNQ